MAEPRAARNDPRRKADLAAIHIAVAQLGIDDDAYRTLLHRITGQRSAALLGAADRQAVRRELERLGWQPTPAKAAGRARLPSDPLSRKLRQVWLDLHHAGAIANPSEASLDRWVLRMTGVHSLAFCEPALKQSLIERAKDWRQRVAALPGPDAGAEPGPEGGA